MIRLALGFVVVLATGCGGKAGNSFECKPACPSGSHCSPSGCVADSEGMNDMAMTIPDQAGACASACSGATPHCDPRGMCVACVEDSHCPAGQLCRAVGLTSVCLPGCKDDARCGGSLRCCAGACIDTSSSAENCGACGRACQAPHAGAACAGGLCTAGGCDPGWADCNQDPADGCEAYVRVDPRNCVRCGEVCAPAHGHGACAGACYITSCEHGWADCNAEIGDGCEVSVLDDTRNCGGCASVCPAVPRAVVACSVGSCLIRSCAQGFGDCNQVFNDGCEINHTTDRSNCGGCGVACEQGQVCVNSECTCPPCSFPNARAACVNKRCVLDTCVQGWGDCDANVANGCERNIATDRGNCGGCGLACAQGLVCVNGGCTCPQCNYANGVSRCVNNVCVLDRCLPGFADCDKDDKNGCEINTGTDARHCSACGMACPNGKPICDRGACTSIPAPIIHFDAADPNSYPGNGRVWTDLTGSGVQGSLINNITFGALGNVKTLIFDGAGAGVNFPNATLDERTFGGIYWVYSKVPQAIADQGGLYVNWTRREWNPANWVAFFKWDVDLWYFRVNNGACCQDIPGSGVMGNNFSKHIPQNVWTMVHFFYQIGTQDGWKWGANGKNVSVSTINGRAVGQAEPTSVIGWGHAMQGGYWIGGITSVRFYNVLLTDEQIGILFESTRAAHGL